MLFVGQKEQVAILEVYYVTQKKSRIWDLVELVFLESSKENFIARSKDTRA